jgi:hypothetical protein
VEKAGFLTAVVVSVVSLGGDLTLSLLLLLLMVRLSNSRSRFAVLAAEEYASTHPI